MQLFFPPRCFFSLPFLMYHDLLLLFFKQNWFKSCWWQEIRSVSSPTQKRNPGQVLINCFVLLILHSLAANFSKRRILSAGAEIKHICYNKSTKPINDGFFITIKYKHVFLFYCNYQTRINIILYIASLHGELNYVKSLPPVFLPSKKHFNCKFAFWSL